MQFPIQIVRPKSKCAYFGRKRLSLVLLKVKHQMILKLSPYFDSIWFKIGAKFENEYMAKALSIKLWYSATEKHKMALFEWFILYVTHHYDSSNVCNVRKLRRNYKKERKASVCNHLVAVLIIFLKDQSFFNFSSQKNQF